ncbi:zinc ribbon domain-containing protein [uncultured Methanobrevibacter sp.]|uniref:zinc ribbon domain-containing protein n=1 Tax=uncultured Methanobrevibacter sp. TaxID=253161 RepID=UPI002624EC9A|nr:zinc ribbon domain-containing protein [uncultured Methanobrevibacter sp.]
MANFCSNCGSKLRKEDNFCSNCGVKIDKSDMGQNPHLNSMPDSIEKEMAKKELKRVVGGRILYNKTFGNELHRNGLDVVITGKAIRQQVEKEIDSGQIKSEEVEFRVNQLILEYKIKKETRIAKEKEEENKKLKMIDEIFESEEIKSEIRKNNISQIDVISIKATLKDKLINKRENMSESEIKHFIKAVFEKVGKPEKARITKEMENNEMKSGGYCSLNCRHCYEEFLDRGGGIVGDFDSEGYVEYYCRLGHSISFGSFCKYYK